MAFPTKDTLLVPYSTNWDTRITATPTVFGLTAAQATAYTALHDPYVAAYDALRTAVEAGVRSKSLATAKDTAKNALLAYGRQLYAFVQASVAVTDANKDLLGVTVRSMPSPRPAPAVAPGLDIVSVTGRTVKIRLHDADQPTRRGKPLGCAGATVMTYVGATPPDNVEAYVFQGNTTKLVVDIPFPDSVAPGALVWVCAFWRNEKDESGPACTPQSTHLQYGGVSMAA